jgi:hypothetical protein
MRMRRIEFRCTNDTYGMPFPHIPNGTVIIMVHEGRAQVGRYEEPQLPDKPWPAFAHPTNVAELETDAMRQVLGEFADIDPNKESLVFTCPQELAARAVW